MSSIVARRVLPALLGLDGIGKVHVASRRPVDLSRIPSERRGRCWNDYGEALAECDADLVYISLPNAEHATWARLALERGFHVVVDKPAVVGDFSQADALAELAISSSLVLAEATVWSCHPLAGELVRIAGRNDRGPLAVIATFTSPRMERTNFRYSRELGGGAILDRGPYAASCGRLIFGEPPTEVSCEVLGETEGPNGVDLSFGTVLRYRRGVLLGFFSLESEYQNRIELIGEAFACSVDRVFTPPQDHQGAIRLRERNVDGEVPVKAGDAFALFIAGVLDSMRGNDFETHAQALLDDARVLERIWNAARRGSR